MKEYIKNFINETFVLLEKLEAKCLEAENRPGNNEIISELTRIMHTIKGAAAMFGYKDIENLTHNAENLFTNILTEKITYSPEITDICFDLAEFIRLSFGTDTNEQTLIAKKQNILLKINKFIELKLSEDKTIIQNQSAVYYIIFRPNADFSERGVNLNNIISDVENLGNVVKYERVDKETIRTKGSKFYMFWEFIVGTELSEDDLREVFFFVEEEVEIHKIADSNILSSVAFQKKLKQIENLPAPIDISLFDFKHQSLSETTIFEKEEKQLPELQITTEVRDFINIDSRKSDEMMNLVSELVTIKESLVISANNLHDKKLSEISEKLEKLTRKIQDNALNIRLVPLSKIMIRFEKQIRDLAIAQGKEIVFEKEGIETELDKAIVDNLSEPLIHVFRNAVDHGLETPEEREMRGKNRKGRIKLFAACSGNYVTIQIHDDGRGIDPDIIRKTAVQRNIISESLKLSDSEIVNLIFTPGFSTAENLSSVSGRGIGMDIIKQKINNLRGEVEINSEKGLGTYITIRLPLTLSIVDALTVEINNQNYLIPKDIIVSAAEISALEEKNIKNSLFLMNGEWIPVLKLKEKFGQYSQGSEFRNILTFQYKSKNYGLIVDKIIGEYQAVVKPIGELFQKDDSFSGASILGNGKLSLMIDVNKTIKKYF